MNLLYSLRDVVRIADASVACMYSFDIFKDELSQRRERSSQGFLELFSLVTSLAISSKNYFLGIYYDDL